MPGRVLIVDPLSTNRIVLRVRLSAAFHDVAQAATGQEALDCLADTGAALAVIAADLPDMGGIALCRRIRARHPAGSLPIVMIARTLDTRWRIDALEAGADVVLERPVNETLLLSRIRCLLRASEGLEELRLREGSSRALGLSEPAHSFHGPGRIAVTGEDNARAQALCAALSGRLPHRIGLIDGPGLVRADCTAGGLDLGIVLLTGQPADPALQLIAGLRARPETRTLAIMALLPAPDDGMIAGALDHGASDAMATTSAAAEFDLRIGRLIAGKRRADRLRDTVHDGLRAAVTDALTGLHNRRYALPQLDRMAQEARARNESLAVMIADLDHFKSVNDRFGHAVGDAVLQQVAQRLRGAVRPGDLLARIGGEEFLIAMPRRSCPGAKGAARALCLAVRQTPLRIAGCPAPIRQTISVGLAMSGPRGGGRGAEALLAQADRALYSAKTGGRNMVTLAAQSAA